MIRSFLNRSCSAGSRFSSFSSKEEVVDASCGPQASSKALKSSGGFTLVEILLVIGLIALLATVLISNVGRFFGTGQEDVARLWVNKTAKASLEMYRLHMRDYPSTSEGLKALRKAPSGKEANWKGPYLDDDPVDPWGHEYKYTYPGVKNPGGYDVWSTGRSGRDGGDDTIGNWQKEK